MTVNKDFGHCASQLTKAPGSSTLKGVDAKLIVSVTPCPLPLREGEMVRPLSYPGAYAL